MLMQEKLMRSVFGLASFVFYGNSVHGDWIYEKMHRPSSAYIMSRNIAKYIRKKAEIYKPISATIEPVFGCNLKCTYCGHQLAETRLGRPLRERPFFMVWETFQKIVEQLPGSVEAVNFALMGEPLLHPEIIKMIDYTAGKGFRTTLFTNGTLLKNDTAKWLANTKLDVLNISVEPDSETALKYRGIDLDEIIGNVRDFNAGKSSATEIKLSLVAHEGNIVDLESIRKRWSGMIRHIKVNPHMDYNEEADRTSCLEPWRGGLNFYTNGNVSPCCIDADMDLVIGNIRDNTLSEILSGAEYRELLESLITGELRDRCRYCAELRSPATIQRLPKLLRRITLAKS